MFYHYQTFHMQRKSSIIRVQDVQMWPATPAKPGSLGGSSSSAESRRKSAKIFTT